MPSPFTTPVAQSVPFEQQRNPDYAEQASIITAQNCQDAIEEVFHNAPGKQARFTITLLNTGIMNNGQRFGYSASMSSVPVILPRKCRLKEITFSNSNASANARFRIYARTPTTSQTPSGTLLYTWDLSSTLATSLTGLDLLFTAGQEILVNFVNPGGLLSPVPIDAAMVLFFVYDNTP